jgi:hypothetical protein
LGALRQEKAITLGVKPPPGYVDSPAGRVDDRDLSGAPV